MRPRFLRVITKLSEKYFVPTFLFYTGAGDERLRECRQISLLILTELKQIN